MATKTTKENFETAMNTGKEQLESAVKAGTQAAQKGFEQTIETAKKQLDELIKGYDEVASFNRENIEACISSTRAAAKAAESINSEVFALTKGWYEANIESFKTLAQAKSPREFFEIQSDLVKTRYEEALSSANKINGLVSTVANEALAPLTARAAVAAEKFTKAFA